MSFCNLPSSHIVTMLTLHISGSITSDLRQYLNTRFPKGGVDHDLQNTIRDNLYLRTVPVTTRYIAMSQLGKFPSRRHTLSEFNLNLSYFP